MLSESQSLDDDSAIFSDRRKEGVSEKRNRKMNRTGTNVRRNRKTSNRGDLPFFPQKVPYWESNSLRDVPSWHLPAKTLAVVERGQ